MAANERDRASRKPEQSQVKDKRPGMMGDQTEEQNLNQPGRPEARIKKDEVEQAFKNKKS